MSRFAWKIIACLAAAILFAGCAGGKSGQPEGGDSAAQAAETAAAPAEASPAPAEAEPDETEGTVVPIFEELTDIPAEAVVMRVGEREITSEYYFYWLCFVCSSLEYNIVQDYNAYGLYASCIDTKSMTVDWTSKLAGLPLMEYARAQAEDTVRYYISIEELAEENGVTLTDGDLADMASVFDRQVAAMGGPEAFRQYLRILGISRETFDRITAAAYLYDGMLAQVLTEGSPLYLADPEYDRYAKFADHILIATQDIKSGEQLAPAKVMEKYELAKDLRSRLDEAEDPAALFEELKGEYSEDPGKQEYPDGYVYTPGTMVPEFESAAAALPVGGISDVVQSDYGFHIILRRDLNEALRRGDGQREEIARSYLDELLVQKRSGSPAVYDACLDGMDWIGFYSGYVAAVDRIAAEG